MLGGGGIYNVYTLSLHLTALKNLKHALAAALFFFPPLLFCLSNFIFKMSHALPYMCVDSKILNLKGREHNFK